MQKILHIKNHVIGEGIPLVCVPVMCATREEIVAEVRRLVELGAEMVEWRVDAFEAPADMNAVRAVLAELAPLVKDTVLVYTFRSAAQGGLRQLTEEETRDVHMVAAESGVPDLIDIEYFTNKRTMRTQKEITQLQSMGARVIASHHDFAGTPKPEIMRMLMEQMRDSGADVVKLAVMPQTAADVLALLFETNLFHERYPKVPLITMSMGQLGGVSRISGEVFGSCVTFGAAGRVSAPGQLPMEELTQMLILLHGSEGGV